MATWTDNYGNTYQEPYIPSKIVGFSGIDPMLVMPNKDDAEYIAELDEAGKNQAVKSIDHEKIDGLLGGDEDGHYHMTEAEYSKLQDVLTLYEAGDTKHALTSEQYNTFTKVQNLYQVGDGDDDSIILDFGEVTLYSGEQP